MGLYIKNLKMSEHCMDYPFMVSRDNDDCILQSAEANENFENWEQMKAGCPLIEIPEPHGDLIDRDALFKKCEFVCTDDDEDIRAVRYSIIENAPTVIPASKEGLRCNH